MGFVLYVVQAFGILNNIDKYITLFIEISTDTQTYTKRANEDSSTNLPAY